MKRPWLAWQADLLGFFEQEPELRDRKVPSIYDELRFDVARGSDRVRCVIRGAEGRLAIEWAQDGEVIASLDLHKAASIEVERDEHGGTLVARFDEASELRQVRLRLRPRVHLFLQTASYDDDLARGTPG